METWLQLTSGRGPSECELVVAKVLGKILEAARLQNIQVDVISAEPGYEPKTFASVLIALKGVESKNLTETWSGTIRWTAKSPYRPNHKRKNWFIGSTGFIPVESEDIDLKNIKLETMRATGPGGQNVNKVATAIRITHLPTGIAVVAREERSQAANRKLATAKLLTTLKALDTKKIDSQVQEQWNKHNSLERGNPKIAIKESLA